jgi:hypothetical protein
MRASSSPPLLSSPHAHEDEVAPQQRVDKRGGDAHGNERGKVLVRRQAPARSHFLDDIEA